MSCDVFVRGSILTPFVGTSLEVHLVYLVEHQHPKPLILLLAPSWGAAAHPHQVGSARGGFVRRIAVKNLEVRDDARRVKQMGTLLGFGHDVIDVMWIRAFPQFCLFGPLSCNRNHGISLGEAGICSLSSMSIFKKAFMTTWGPRSHVGMWGRMHRSGVSTNQTLNNRLQ